MPILIENVANTDNDFPRKLFTDILLPLSFSERLFHFLPIPIPLKLLDNTDTDTLAYLYNLNASMVF